MSTASLSKVVVELAARRTALGLSARELSIRMDIALGSVRSWETGTTQPNARQLERWAAEMGCELRLVETGEVTR